MSRSMIIGTGIGASIGGLAGFISPKDSIQDRVVSGIGGAMLGGFLGGGLMSAAKYKPVEQNSPFLQRNKNKRFFKETRKKISNVYQASSQANKFSKSNKTKTSKIYNKAKKNSYYDTIDRVRSTGDAAKLHVAYVDSINHAKRKGNDRALNQFLNDPYVKSRELLTNKAKGIWK